VIAPGMLADMVLLDADPLADITNTRRIWRVIKAGTVHHPATLLTALN
jgi:imidazolonepropionase-like amidohydrolase